jgi:hypothetical protein
MTTTNNNKPFIDLKYYTRIAAHCKYSYDWESEIFTKEIDIDTWNTIQAFHIW